MIAFYFMDLATVLLSAVVVTLIQISVRFSAFASQPVLNLSKGHSLVLLVILLSNSREVTFLNLARKHACLPVGREFNQYPELQYSVPPWQKKQNPAPPQFF